MLPATRVAPALQSAPSGPSSPLPGPFLALAFPPFSTLPGFRPAASQGDRRQSTPRRESLLQTVTLFLVDKIPGNLDTSVTR